MSIKKGIRNMRLNLARFTEFPVECTGDVSVIEIKDSNEAYVSGCIRIQNYTKEKIELDGHLCRYMISGENLIMSDFSDSCIRIDGKIFDIKICGKDAVS